MPEVKPIVINKTVAASAAGYIDVTITQQSVIRNLVQLYPINQQMKMRVRPMIKRPRDDAFQDLIIFPPETEQYIAGSGGEPMGYPMVIDCPVGTVIRLSYVNADTVDEQTLYINIWRSV